MRRDGPGWTAPFRQLEARLLSDDRLALKQRLAWLLLMGMVGYFGVGSEWRPLPGHYEYLFHPTRYAEQPLTFTFNPILAYDLGDGYLLRSYLGFVPLRVSSPPEGLAQFHSIRGVWNADGTVTVLEDWTHPLRPLKTQLSAIASILLPLALFWRYWLRRQPGPP